MPPATPTASATTKKTASTKDGRKAPKSRKHIDDDGDSDDEATAPESKQEGSRPIHRRPPNKLHSARKPSTSKTSNVTRKLDGVVLAVSPKTQAKQPPKKRGRVGRK